VSLLFVTTTINAEEMDHSQHNMQDHASHDTGSAKHIHHEHGKGGWMVEYKFMRMEMDGLLDGTDDVSSEDISGMQMRMGDTPIKRDDKDYMMSPTDMTMDMHMIMGMYGFTDWFTMMLMGQYLVNDMNMVMHMYNPAGDRVPQMDQTPTIETSNLDDTKITAMFKVGKISMLSLGLSIPTGSIDERVAVMDNPDALAPYRMQLGSGTYDIIPAYTYQDTSGKMAWGSQFEYTLRTGTNDKDYTLGDRWELSGWFKHYTTSHIMLSGRLEYLDWDNVDGVAKGTMTMMSPAFDPNSQGGKRADILVGISGMFGKGHMIGAEFGVPFYQNLDGPQLATEYIVSLAYQFMME